MNITGISIDLDLLVYVELFEKYWRRDNFLDCLKFLLHFFFPLKYHTLMKKCSDVVKVAGKIRIKMFHLIYHAKICSGFTDILWWLHFSDSLNLLLMRADAEVRH